MPLAILERGVGYHDHPVSDRKFKGGYVITELPG